MKNTIIKIFSFFVFCLFVSAAYSQMPIKKNNMNNQSTSLNERFSSLQSYLDWSANARIADMPRYQEVSKGYYKFRRSRGQARDDRIYSYEELKDKLGFSK